MPAYAYSIKINYGRETVTKDHRRTIGPRLTTKKLEAIVGDAVFTVLPDDAQFSNDYLVYWTTKQLETDTEMAARIKKGETYNTNREHFLKTGELPT